MHTIAVSQKVHQIILAPEFPKRQGSQAPEHSSAKIPSARNSWRQGFLFWTFRQMCSDRRSLHRHSIYIAGAGKSNSALNSKFRTPINLSSHLKVHVFRKSNIPHQKEHDVLLECCFRWFYKGFWFKYNQNQNPNQNQIESIQDQNESNQI